MTNLDAKRYIHKTIKTERTTLVLIQTATENVICGHWAGTLEDAMSVAQAEIAKRYKAGEILIAKDGTQVQRRREADLRAGEWEGSAKYHWHADGMRVRCHWYLTTERRNEDGLMTRTRSPDSRACWVAFENL